MPFLPWFSGILPRYLEILFGCSGILPKFSRILPKFSTNQNFCGCPCTPAPLHPRLLHHWLAVTYIGNFNGGVSFSDMWWSFFIWYALCDVTLWRHIHVSKQRFGKVCWHNIHILLHVLPYFMCQCTEYKLSALQIRISEETTINATTQQFITAKISGCALKQGSKTHSSLHQKQL